MFGFIGDIAKAISGAVSGLTKVLGVGKLDSIFGGMGGVSGLLGMLGKIAGASNPFLAAFAVLNDVLGALRANKDEASKDATSSAAKSILGQLPAARNFRLYAPETRPVSG